MPEFPALYKCIYGAGSCDIPPAPENETKPLFHNIEAKMMELSKEINKRIDKECNRTADARKALKEKLAKVDEKIDTMLNFKNDIIALSQDLKSAEQSLLNIITKVDKLDEHIECNSEQLSSLRSSIHYLLPKNDNMDWQRSGGRRMESSDIFL